MAFEPRLCTSDEPVLADLSFCGPAAADATGMTGMGLPGGPSACSRARTRKASEPIFFRFSSALAARAASSPVGAAWWAAGAAADCEASASPGGASSATASRTGSPGGLSGDPAGSGGWLFPDQGDSLRTLPPMPFIGSGGAATLSSHPARDCWQIRHIMMRFFGWPGENKLCRRCEAEAEGASPTILC